MREIIKLHLGSFGISVADELYSQEYHDFTNDERFNHLTQDGVYKPRAVLIDLETDDLNRFMTDGRARDQIDFDSCHVFD